MHSAERLMEKLTARGFKFSVDGDRLGVVPADRLTDEDREGITLHRTDILAAVKNAEVHLAHPDDVAQHEAAPDASNVQDAPAEAIAAPAPEVISDAIVQRAPAPIAAPALARHLQPAEPDPVDAILLLGDPIVRGKALAHLAREYGGAVLFTGILSIRTYGRLWRTLVDAISNNKGGVLQSLPDSFISSSAELEIIGDVLDAAPAALSESDPRADWRPFLRSGTTVRDAVATIVAELNGLCWLNGDIRRAESKFAEYSDADLDQPAAKAGASFQNAWVRGASGQLFIVPRVEVA